MPHIHPVVEPDPLGCASLEARPCALIGDPNTHGEGRLRENWATFVGTANTTIRIHGRLVALDDQNADWDGYELFGHRPAQTRAIAESCGKVRIHGQRIHRVGDRRRCGAVTVADPEIGTSGRFFIR